MKKILVLLMALLLATSGLSTAAILDFEDLNPPPGWYVPISSPYHGFTMSASSYGIDKNYDVNSGYFTGTFGNVSMFNGLANQIWMTNASLSILNDLYLTSAWNASQDAIIQGWLGGYGGTLVYDTTVNINNLGPTHVVLNWTGIDTLYFNSNNGNQLVIDNITYNGAAPLPSTLLFLSTGLLGLVGRRFWS
jgi:hypothetical protein